MLERVAPAELCSLPERELLQIGMTAKQAKSLASPPMAKIEQALLWAEQPNQSILTFDSPSYPSLLKEIASPPPVLFVRGNPSWLSEPQIAVIGSRNASIDGRESAYQFAASLVAADYVVTSGLALGIDGQAHAGALKGGGATVAVLGAGLDKIYPARHRELALSICEQGALVSEFWPTEPPRPQNFPRRNRV
ncbi:DNA-processing protein DprA, partial [Photobacterium sanctipauli]|uniref:DNA-processing protein DprA n=1 Tax=Photobacterium sanctipauli TaxID=1342794 RepID=UPI0030844EBC